MLNCNFYPLSLLVLLVATNVGHAQENEARLLQQQTSLPSERLQSATTSSNQLDDPYRMTFDSLVGQTTEVSPQAAVDVLKVDELVTADGSVQNRGAMVASVDTDQALGFVRQRLALHPENYALQSLLAELLLRKAKTEDDLPAFGAATNAARAAVKLNPEYAPAQLALAQCLMASHEFREALDLVEKLNSAAPGQPRFLASLVDCHLELGNYSRATELLQELLSLEQSPPVLARSARLAELRGDRIAAVITMDRALQIATDRGAAPESSAWYHWRRGSLLLDAGKLKDAMASFQAALSVAPDDEPSLVGCGLVHFGLGELDQAIEMLEQAAKSEAPPTLALLGDALALSGQHERADHLWQRTEQLMREEALVAKQAHAREVALFFADHDLHLDEALELSTADLALRPDAFAWDVHAWVLFKNNRLDEATDAIRHALEHVPASPRLLFHASVIEHAAGNEQEAMQCIRQLEQLNPRFSITYHQTFQDLLQRTRNSQ